MDVTYVGHAAILVRTAKGSLLMDPWLQDPTYCNSWFHYPPLVHRIEDLLPVDYVWCSHEHPDHFDPPTLAKLPRDQKFLVPPFTSKRLERGYAALGFENLIPLPWGEDVELAEDLRVTCLRTDLVWEDSALIVKSADTTLFNMNDCKLGDTLLRGIGEQHRPDIAFVPFSGAIQYPTCYDYDDERLAALCAERRRGHLEQFVHRIEFLGARHAVPFAGNFALLHRDQVWMNDRDKNNINTPDEAVALLAEKLPDVEGLQMNPGDRWNREDGLIRHAPPPDFADKMTEIRALAEAVAPHSDLLRAEEPPARPSLRADFAAYFEDISRRHPEICTRIAARVVFDAQGENGGCWCLDFADGRVEVSDFSDGDPWNLRMTVPASMLQQAVDGEVTFDALALSFRMRFAENPEFFNRDFWVMLYNSETPFLEAYLADPAPRF